MKAGWGLNRRGRDVLDVWPTFGQLQCPTEPDLGASPGTHGPERSRKSGNPLLHPNVARPRFCTPSLEGDGAAALFIASKGRNLRDLIHAQDDAMPVLVGQFDEGHDRLRPLAGWSEAVQLIRMSPSFGKVAWAVLTVMASSQGAGVLGMGCPRDVSPAVVRGASRHDDTGAEARRVVVVKIAVEHPAVGATVLASVEMSLDRAFRTGTGARLRHLEQEMTITLHFKVGDRDVP